MLSNIGLPELLIALAVWLLPLAAFTWALATLARLRRGQDEILTRLAELEDTVRDATRGPLAHEGSGRK